MPDGQRPVGKLPLTVTSPVTAVPAGSTTTTDETAGVQTGELGVVTETGFASLHDVPRGFIEITGF